MMRRILPDAAALDAAIGAAPELKHPAQSITPVIWLIGKAQSGKTSILRAITQSTTAEIGNGFKACTRSLQMFDFPADYPILRFLDTRGLGEVGYDPAEDLAVAEQRAHLLLVTMRAMDVGQGATIDVVKELRRKHPDWPVVVAQTCLHEGYGPDQGHLEPYPFTPADRDLADVPHLPQALARALRYQRDSFESLPGKGMVVFVPIDLTLPTDAMPPADYGLPSLMDTLVAVAPAAMRAALQALPKTDSDGRRRSTDPIILGHALAAGGSDLVPVAGAVAVTAIQARLLQRIGQIFGVTWDRQILAEFSAALGASVAIRALIGVGARQLAKFIPIYGQTVGAAASSTMSYAVTFAIGKAAAHFLTQRERGRTTDGTAMAFQEALRDALRRAKTTLAANPAKREQA